MEAFDQLGLITEIAATLLGFVAVFLALSNKEGRFDESDRHFVQGLVLVSTSCVLLGLTPRALSLFLEGTLWTYGLGVFLFVGVILSAVMGWTQIRMAPEEKAKLHVMWHVPSWSLATIVSVLVVMGLVHDTQAAGYYVGAASVLVGIALWCFIAIVFRRFF